MRDYRTKHLSKRTAKHYDEVIYAPGSLGSILWQIESRILDRVVVEFRKTHDQIDYLDFACGTGRVLTHLESSVNTATGIDISGSMLDRAANKVLSAKLVCVDITNGSILNDQYDLITCFRFLTNADQELRDATLRSLAACLKDSTSLLIVNIHGNLWSYRLILWPYHWLQLRLTGRAGRGYLTTRQAKALLKEAGFAVRQVIGLNFIPKKLHFFMPHGFTHWLEHCLAGAPVIQAFGAEQILLCQRAASAPDTVASAFMSVKI